MLSPDGKTLYIANEDDNLVTVIDIEARRVLAEIPVGVEPEGMGISPDGKTMVNTSETTNMAHFIDTATHEITHNVLVDSRPRFAEFTPDGKEVWVTAEIGGTVSVIDNATREVKHKITFEIAGPARRGDPAGRRAHHRGRQEGLRGARARRTASRWSTPRPTRWRNTCWSASASGSSPSRPTRRRSSRTNGVSNDITFIDVATDEPVQSVTVGALPWGVVVSPN